MWSLNIDLHEDYLDLFVIIDGNTIAIPLHLYCYKNLKI